jgi:hypothetical protein
MIPGNVEATSVEPRMDLDELLNHARTLAGQESCSEDDVAKVAQELQDEVARITQHLDPNDPDVVALRARAADIIHNIELALAADAEQRAFDDASIARQKAAAVYAWEKLPVYEWNNRFARVIGRLLSQVPKRHLIHVHNLAGQATVMSICISMTHPDMPPEEMPSLEQRHAYATIGRQASKTAGELLQMLAVKSGSTRTDALHGIDLVRKIEQQFAADVCELENGTPARPALLH